MKQLLSLLNNTTGEWRILYDLQDAVPMEFTQKEGILYLNDLSLCPAQNLILSVQYYEIDAIGFLFENGQMIIIEIGWPEEEPPFVDSVIVKYRHHASDG